MRRICYLRLFDIDFFVFIVKHMNNYVVHLALNVNSMDRLKTIRRFYVLSAMIDDTLIYC